MDKKKKKKLFHWGRILVQIVMFLSAPSLFAQAFAAVKETAGTLGKGGVLTVSGFVIRLFILCIITFFFGRIFCGWLCAFGAVNDWIYQLSSFLQKKTGKKLPRIPEKWIPGLQKIKYFILLFILVCCFFDRSGWITKNSPWTVFSLLTARNLKLAEYMTALLFCLLFVIGMIFHERFFCQFFCPMGAIFSLLPELPLTSLKRQEKDCIKGCSACQKNCPVHIKLGGNNLQSGECIRCGRCLTICPKGNISAGFHKSRL